MNDQELVAAVRSGEAAFDTLVERYHTPLLRFLVRLTGDRELAEDLTQDSFIAAYQQLYQLADDRSFAAWLYQIARNQLRSNRRRRQLIRFFSLDWLAAPAGRPYAAVAHAQESQAEQDLVQGALNRLSPPLREALLLHHLWGFSGREIAGILEISPAAAQKRVSRADQEFRLHYDALTGDASR